MDKKPIIKNTAKVVDPDFLTMKLIEEMGEATQALSKKPANSIIEKDDSNALDDNICEEVAHVKVFIEVLQCSLDKTNFKKHYHDRIKRLSKYWPNPDK